MKPVLEKAIEMVLDCRLIIIDPIDSFLGGKTDAHHNNEVHGVLALLAKLAERTGAAVIVIAHNPKSKSSHADENVLGSRALMGLARVTWHLLGDSENPDRRLFLQGKCKIAAKSDGLAFVVGGNPASIRWESEPVDMSANDALAKEAESPNGTSGGSAVDAAPDLRNGRSSERRN